MPTHRSFFALLLLASCGGELPPGPSPPPAPGLRDFEDGARLRGQFVGTVAGETQQVGIFDRSLGIACAFQPDQTERLRCLPPRSTGELFWSGYADAACTRALWYALSTLPDDAHLATVPVTGEKGFEVRPVERLTAPQVVFERSLGGGCGRAPDLMAGRAVLGPPVDPAMFVAARAAAPRPNPGRSLTTWQLEAEDGSRFQTGLFDLALGRACTPLRLDDQAGICLGGPLAWQGPEVFADDACTHSLVTGFPVHDQAEPVAYLDGDVPHAVGSRWDGPLWRRWDGVNCQPADRLPGQGYYERGAVLQPPALTFAFEGKGRVKREVLRDQWNQLLGGTGALVEGGGQGLRDSQDDGICAPLHVPDGSFRCVTVSVGYLRAGRFADAACGVPAVGVSSGSTSSSEGKRGLVALLGEDPGPFGAITGVHALAAPTYSFYLGAPGSCMGPMFTKEDVTPLGAPVALPSFEPLVTNVER